MKCVNIQYIAWGLLTTMGVSMMGSFFAPVEHSQSYLAASIPGVCNDDNLLLNGGFDAVDDRVGIQRGRQLNNIDGGYDVFLSLPDVTDGSGTSWTTVDGPGIQIDADGRVVDSKNGMLHAELDSIANSSMSQDVDLQAGDYRLSFWYYARTGRTDDNIIEVLFDGDLIHTENGTSSSDWELIELDIADVSNGIHTLTFRAGGIDNSLGAFIDAVDLTCESLAFVPETTSTSFSTGSVPHCWDEGLCPEGGIEEEREQFMSLEKALRQRHRNQLFQQQVWFWAESDVPADMMMVEFMPGF